MDECNPILPASVNHFSIPYLGFLSIAPVVGNQRLEENCMKLLHVDSNVITDFTFIRAEGMAMGNEARNGAMDSARKETAALFA